MITLHKAKEITSIPLSRIKTYNILNCNDIVFEVGNIVDKNLISSCNVKSIFHYHEIKAFIKIQTSKVTLQEANKPGKTIEWRDEPKELKCFSYDQLRQLAQYKNNVYRGKLYGTIEHHTCNILANCPECNGSGICTGCEGNKQITCTVCEGCLECRACNGTGLYTCENCDGDGDCPECYNGWIECGDCYGSGEYRMACNRCGGSGWYDPYRNKQCFACNGTGEYITECRNCDGDGGWDCEECHGTGNCSHCRGNGHFKCKACDGSGECGKCKGHGKIWCPDCHGKGQCFNCKGDKQVTCPQCNGIGCYQTYKEYTFSEQDIVIKDLCTLPIDQEHIKSIGGDLCYEGVIYDFFAQKANIFDTDSAIQSLGGIKVKEVTDWLALENNSSFKKDKISNDYLNTYVELYKIPITKIVLVCNSKEYTIWIVGNNRCVFYDNLPNLRNMVWGRIKKFFN